MSQLIHALALKYVGGKLFFLKLMLESYLQVIVEVYEEQS